ncbi:hypothetical protein A3BBH6_06010 [Alistipes onderdonkii subsp. vulgaris]|uniref:hypothetical protein n=1 Tax=Alistipes onderdonkii TaxID=328813 RepID=UPI001142BA28|nr:hypothetical protein [Alistipes onderdonkii]BBL00365.1 hypothetical protein A3BBH6_06010 [Alistipes onderdonkii subsp. vulgaris]
MNVTHETVIRIAEEKTDNAFYLVEYSISGDKILRIQATVMEKNSSATNPNVIGTIYQEQDTVSCSFPAERSLPAYFEDFEQFQQLIVAGFAKK